MTCGGLLTGFFADRMSAHAVGYQEQMAAVAPLLLVRGQLHRVAVLVVTSPDAHVGHAGMLELVEAYHGTTPQADRPASALMLHCQPRLAQGQPLARLPARSRRIPQGPRFRCRPSLDRCRTLPYGTRPGQPARPGDLPLTPATPLRIRLLQSRRLRDLSASCREGGKPCSDTLYWPSGSCWQFLGPAASSAGLSSNRTRQGPWCTAMAFPWA